MLLPFDRSLPLLGLFLLSSCSEPQADFSPYERQLEAVQILRTHPIAGSNNVDPLGVISFCFSHRLDPASLGANDGSFDAELRSGRALFDAEIELQLVHWYALDSSNRGAPPEDYCPGSVLTVRPESPLSPGLSYRVILGDQLRGWSGEFPDFEQQGWRLEEDESDDENSEGPYSFVLEFRTQDVLSKPEPPSPELTVSLQDLFELGGIFHPENPSCSCHRDDEHLGYARLNLSDPTTALRELVDRESVESTGYPMISPRRPSESYFLQKLLREPDGDKLFSVQGQAMPPEHPLEYDELAMIARWIADGALLERSE